MDLFDMEECADMANEIQALKCMSGEISLILIAELFFC